ncbi:hypothetical protein AAVH_14847 [Aphelenchoides avenae]|nr:hypothetical protein AAVH_14847 [Aphelenchus avenae]
MNVELERQQEQLRYLRYHHMPVNVLQTVGLEQGYMVPGKGRAVACSSTPGKSVKATLFTKGGSPDLNATLLPPTEIPPV